jgi:hypothetical protein
MRKRIRVMWAVDRVGRSGRKEDTVKRLALIIVTLGTALALAPAASALIPSGDAGGTDSGVVFRADVLGGDGNYAAKTALTDGWMASVTSSGITLRPDILGGHGGVASAPAAGTDDSFDWSTALGATLTGMLLLALAGAAVTRRRHRLSF